MKRCSKCKIEKELSEFHKNKRMKDGLAYRCKACNKERLKKYYQDNAEHIKERNKEYNRKWYQDNVKYRKERMKQYNQNNKERINKYLKQRRQTDPLFKLNRNLRNRTYKAFKNKGYSKTSKTQQMLGVDWEVAKAHIERQFTKGMNWGNYGEWHIDHIISLASANTKEEMMKLCHYTNLQPLWAEENLSKGDKILKNTQIKFRI